MLICRHATLILRRWPFRHCRHFVTPATPFFALPLFRRPPSLIVSPPLADGYYAAVSDVTIDADAAALPPCCCRRFSLLLATRYAHGATLLLLRALCHTLFDAAARYDIYAAAKDAHNTGEVLIAYSMLK